MQAAANFGCAVGLPDVTSQDTGSFDRNLAWARARFKRSEQKCVRNQKRKMRGWTMCIIIKTSVSKPPLFQEQQR